MSFILIDILFWNNRSLWGNIKNDEKLKVAAVRCCCRASLGGFYKKKLVNRMQLQNINLYSKSSYGFLNLIITSGQTLIDVYFY